MNAHLRTVLGLALVASSFLACAAETGETEAADLSQAECSGTADTTFCDRNARQGADQVSACWAAADAPWTAYLKELQAARDDKTHPELAKCAAAEKAKDGATLRKDCATRHAAKVCNALPEAILRMTAELRCYSESPDYKAQNARFGAMEAAYVGDGARCLGLWAKNQLLNAGCYLFQSRLSSDQGSASAACLAKCPAAGPGGVCVPAKYKDAREPVPCGVVAVRDGVCDCSAETSVCDYYQDGVDHPDGLAFCPPGTIATPHVQASTNGGAPKMVPTCDVPPWANNR